MQSLDNFAQLGVGKVGLEEKIDFCTVVDVLSRISKNCANELHSKLFQSILAPGSRIKRRVDCEKLCMQCTEFKQMHFTWFA